MASLYHRAIQSADFISSLLTESLTRPSLAIICGSGLGGLAKSIRSDQLHVEISYKDIPNFHDSTVSGHAGKLLFGFLHTSNQPVVLMLGRVHFYEGHSIQETAFPVRVLKLLGVQNLIVTNAAGGLNESFAVGDVVVIGDHLNLAGLTGIHPLTGPNAEEFGTRFPSLSDAYDLYLRRMTHRAWRSVQPQIKNQKRHIHEGVYAYVCGPSYETRAECRMLRMLGADVVGMSTIPEVIVARHCGIKILALSLVTNKAILEPGLRGDNPDIADLDATTLAASLSIGAANHSEVIDAGIEAADDMKVLVLAVAQEILVNS